MSLPRRSKTETHTLFAIVDCAHLSKTFFRLLRSDNRIHCKSLFAGTQDQSSAMSGPMLIQTENDTGSEVVKLLLDIQKKAPAVTWLWSEEKLDDVFELLQSILYVVMPDKSAAINRYYDPRCLEDFLLFTKKRSKETHKKLQQITAWAYWKNKTYSIIHSAEI